MLRRCHSVRPLPRLVRTPRNGERRRRSFASRALSALAIFTAVNVAAYFAGEALHPHRAAAAVSCPAVVQRVIGHRDAVAYQDETADPRMSSAIRAAAHDWDAASTNVVLVTSVTRPAIAFRASATTRPVPDCASKTPRSVVVMLGRDEWNSTGGASRVRAPVAAVAKTIGLALGLHSGGRCPALMASSDCSHRNAQPDAAEVAALDRLYPKPR